MAKWYLFNLFSSKTPKRMDVVRRMSSERLLLWVCRLDSAPSVAALAAGKIKRNQKALIRIAQGKRNPEEVRLSALGNLEDAGRRDAIIQSTLQWVMEQRSGNLYQRLHSDCQVKRWVGYLSSQEKILELGRRTTDLEIRAVAIDNLTAFRQEQQELILELATKAENSEIRAAAIDKLDVSNQERLIEIAYNEKDADACTHAFSKITDPAVQLDIYEKRPSYLRTDRWIKRQLMRTAFERGHDETGVELLLPTIPETNYQSPREVAQANRIFGIWADDEAFYRFLENTSIDPDKMRQCVRFLWVQGLDYEVRTTRRNGFADTLHVVKKEAIRRHMESFPGGTFPQPLYINLLLMIYAARAPNYLWTYTNDGDEEFEKSNAFCYDEVRQYVASLIPEGSCRVPSYPYLLKEPAGTPAGI